MIDYLFHYYEKKSGPFSNLSSVPLPDAQKILNGLKSERQTMASQRYDGYLQRRHELESIARAIFIEKGGKPKNEYPHYMVVGKCDWLKSWYIESGFIRIHVSAFNSDAISFSYGDLFPTFSDRVTDNREYRRQVYTLNEIEQIISKYGLPQHWNGQGEFGPERYVEVQVWDDEPLRAFLPDYHNQE